jgi:hypothetical protein
MVNIAHFISGIITYTHFKLQEVRAAAAKPVTTNEENNKLVDNAEKAENGSISK